MVPFSGALCIALFFVWKVHRNTEGPKWWAIGMGVSIVGYCLLSLRGFVPPFASIVVANTFFVVAGALILKGIRAFQGVRRGGALEWGAVAFVFLSFVYFTFVRFDVNARIVIFSAVVALLMFRCSVVVLGAVPNERRGANIISATGFAIVAVFLSLRTALTLMGVGTASVDASAFSANTLTQLAFIVGIFGAALLTFGLAILPGQRAQAELGGEIAERKRAERAYRESEAKYRNLVETSHDLIWSVDADGKITFVNEAGALSVLGYRSDEMVGKPFAFFKTPEEAEEVMKTFAETKKDGHRFNYETNYRAKDGSLVPMNFNAVVLKDGGGNVVGASGTAQDLTERNQIESRLRQAQRMEAVGQLTGGVAHEFNNILQAILGSLEMLGDRVGDDGKAAKIVDIAVGASKRGGKLTQQLLSFSRKQMLSSEAVNINNLLSGFSGSLEETLGDGITIETIFADGLMPVEIDPGGLEVAIRNLARNARSSMPDGGALTIETANVGLGEAISLNYGELPAGEYVAVTVSDTGCGMSAEVLERAFEPFFTTHDVGQGAGLGLSMVYGFTEQSGGHASIDSEPGSGTAVRMYLPIASPSQK
ncbi:MAG: PAS domain S-box protein [Rhodospirillales bacterium]|nr:PAS domain S-box protein [Rhodospirillales bacterium]